MTPSMKPSTIALPVAGESDSTGRAQKDSTMNQRKELEIYVNPPGISRRDFFKSVFGMLIISGSSLWVVPVPAEDVPAEPKDLDETTPWQDGDPEPVEMKVPAEEPKQSSTESPPSRSIDDERPAPPGPYSVWVTGYWWWTAGRYVWVPGYWAAPPRSGYVYVSGYWRFRGSAWLYVRGGWGKPNTFVVVVYPRPRPVRAAWVIAAPARIVRRHHHWGHYHARSVHHRAVRHAHGLRRAHRRRRAHKVKRARRHK